MTLCYFIWLTLFCNTTTVLSMKGTLPGKCISSHSGNVVSLEEADTIHNCHEASILPLLAMPAKQHSHPKADKSKGYERRLRDCTGGPEHCEDRKEPLQNHLWRKQTQCVYSLCHQWHLYSTTTLLTILLEHIMWRSTYYSFDYARQVHYPSDPLQPGHIYFLMTTKSTVFGVACEVLPHQINFLTDEPGDCDQAARDYIFSNHGFRERDVHLHADNCTGPNKNNRMMQYLVWRTITNRHTNITLVSSRWPQEICPRLVLWIIQTQLQKNKSGKSSRNSPSRQLINWLEPFLASSVEINFGWLFYSCSFRSDMMALITQKLSL